MSDLKRNKQYLNENWTIENSREELEEGLEFLNTIESKMITFFGSHLATHDSKYYQDCKKLAFELGELGYAIGSGGGPGIMHAANAGAIEAKTNSIGFRAELLKNEKVYDNIYTKVLSFKFMFIRRFIMSIKCDALIFYPGGFGTLNELFEYIVLMQTGIVDTVPIICVDNKYWQGLLNWIKENPLKNNFLSNDAKDLKLIYFIDDHKEIIETIKKSLTDGK